MIDFFLISQCIRGLSAGLFSINYGTISKHCPIKQLISDNKDAGMLEMVYGRN